MAFLVGGALCTPIAARAQQPGKVYRLGFLSPAGPPGAKESVSVSKQFTAYPSKPPAWRRAAVFVDKILKGTKPAELPIEQATRFEFVLNLKTAKTLGLTIPPSILVRADQIIE